MFEQTFVDGVGTTKKPYTILLSFVIQAGIVVFFIVLPLIYFETMGPAQLSTFLTAPPPPPPPPPQAVKVVKVVRQMQMNQLVAPKSVPKDVKMIVEDADVMTAGVVGGVPGGVPGGSAGGLLGGIIGGLPAAPPPPPPPPKPKPAPPAAIRVGGQVQAANILRQTRPTYPPLAKAARVQGTVKFEATIAKDGTIQNLKLISGPPLLVQSAMQAVQQWQYKPTLLNGEPVEVLTTIDVNFTLSQ